MSQHSILIVDDHNSLREIMAGQIRQLGYRPFTAKNGRQAMQIIQEHPIDLVLLDVMMPEMDGFQVLQELNDQGLIRQMSVVVVSALADMNNVAKCIELGADDYLFKPIQRQLLRARIHASMQKKRWREQERTLGTIREDMLHTIVHDLRNPINAMMLNVDLLQELLDDENLARVQILLDRLRESTIKSLNLVNTILDISRLESGQIALSPTTVPFSPLVNETLSLQLPLAKKKNIELQYEIPPDLPPTVIDTKLIGRVLQNLIGNAIKFTPQEGRITITAQTQIVQRQNKLLVQVHDTGPGITEEFQAQLFRKFTTGRHPESGSGLGLTFCKMVLDAHGEKIWLEESSAKGTTFTFTLPVDTRSNSS